MLLSRSAPQRSSDQGKEKEKFCLIIQMRITFSVADSIQRCSKGALHILQNKCSRKSKEKNELKEKKRYRSCIIRNAVQNDWDLSNEAAVLRII